MLKRVLLLKMFAVSVLFFYGCASIITMAGPTETKKEDGSFFVGKQGGYTYNVEKHEDRFVVYKLPQCREMKEVVMLTRKKPRGVFFGILEIPLFGLGVADMVTAGMISKNSEVRTIYESKETGKDIPCGSKIPAPGEKLVVDIPELKISKTVVSDDNGIINLEEYLKGSSGDLMVKLCLQADKSCYWDFVHE